MVSSELGLQSDPIRRFSFICILSEEDRKCVSDSSGFRENSVKGRMLPVHEILC